MAAAPNRSGGEVAQRPALLTRRGADILVRVERLMDDATRALAARDEQQGRRAGTQQPARSDTVAASDRQPVGSLRGN